MEKLRDFIRPIAVAALIFVLLAGASLSGALEAFAPGVGKNFTIGVAGWFRAIPDAYYQLTAAGMLGYAAGRTAEKMTSIKATAKFDPPTRSTPDDPDGGPA